MPDTQISDKLSHSGDGFADELSIKGQGLKLENAESCEDLCLNIRRMKSLKVLRLEGNTLGVEAALHIGQALKGRHELERLIMNDVFTGRLKTEIPQALDNLFHEIRSSRTRLIELNLSDNAFGPIGMSSLSSILRSPCCHELQVLRLHNNGLGIQGAKALADSIRFLSHGERKIKLKTLICGRNRLENEGATAIAKALEHSCCLNEIQAPQNGIGADGLLAMFETLRKHTDIQCINFNDNTITGDRAPFIVQALENMSNLEVLNLGDCLLESKGAAVLAETLPSWKNLREAVFSSNEIDQKGVQDILDVARQLCHLQFIDLADNDVSSNFVEKTIQRWTDSSIQLRLGGCSDDDDSIENNSDVSDEAKEKEATSCSSHLLSEQVNCKLQKNATESIVSDSNPISIGDGQPFKKFPGFDSNMWQRKLLEAQSKANVNHVVTPAFFDEKGKLSISNIMSQSAKCSQSSPTGISKGFNLFSPAPDPIIKQKPVPLVSSESMHFKLVQAYQDKLANELRNLSNSSAKQIAYLSGVISVHALLQKDLCSIDSAKRFIDIRISEFKRITSLSNRQIQAMFDNLGINLHKNNLKSENNYSSFIETVVKTASILTDRAA